MWRSLALCLALVAGASARPPVLESIHPTAATLPANHLKFYLHFREPMERGVFLQHCRLVKETGEPVIEPFRETELWSEDGRRLTLWLHPGRQKTGVNLNEEFGPILGPGGRYRLIISGAWKTAAGDAPGQDVERTFTAGPRATRQLDHNEWTVRAPARGTRDPLEIRFPAPLDHALLMRVLRVITATREAVAGSPGTSEEETIWRFTPAAAWQAGEYFIVAESIVEDLAGNSLARPFEVDLTGPKPKRVPRAIEIPFTPVRA